MTPTAHPLIEVAYRAIAASLAGAPFTPPRLPPPWDASRGVFVTLRAPDGALRGCIGHLRPTRATLAEEVAVCAVSSAHEDPRFRPLSAAELDGLRIDISLLHPPEPATEQGLDPARYGVIVTAGHRRAVLLPGLDGIDTVAEQLAIVRRKGGIAAHEPVVLERFEVVRIEAG